MINVEVLVHRFVEARMAYYGQGHEQGPLSIFGAQPNNSKWRAKNLIKDGTRAYREGVVCLWFYIKIETHEFF